MNDVKVINQAQGNNWVLYQGDCVQVIKGIPDNSLDLTVSSPPFGQLYIYSDSEADMGNSANDDEFFTHYEFLIKEMYRATRPGRLNVVHCKDLPAFRNRDGAMGLIDFPGKIIRAFENAVNPEPKLDAEALKSAPSIEAVRALLEAHQEAVAKWKKSPNWQFHSRVTIWKDPVIEMERTKNNGLLHRNFVSNTEVCRQGMADYLIVFRKWGGDETFEVPVQQRRVMGDYIGGKAPEEWEIRPNKRTRENNYSIAVWQRYASPVWMDVQQTNVLNYEQVKDAKDEKHICPLQLDVIRRCIDLWSNKGDVVFDPFAGIGSTAYEAVRLGRRAVGIELKESYWKGAIKYCSQAEIEVAQPTLFDLLEQHQAAQIETAEGL
jgi:DNA modification methylase